jgi:phage terminase large subunit-like protein
MEHTKLEKGEREGRREQGSAGKAYVDHLMRRTLRGFYVFPERPTGDKYTRASR